MPHPLPGRIEFRLHSFHAVDLREQSVLSHHPERLCSVMGEPLRQSSATTLQADCLLVKHQYYSHKRTVRSANDLGERLLRARLEFGAMQKPPRPISQSEVGEALGVT